MKPCVQISPPNRTDAVRAVLIHLLVCSRREAYADALMLSDVLALAGELQFRATGRRNLRRLNLCNQDRQLLTRVMHRLFRTGRVDLARCFEKKALWCGLLHHLHFRAQTKPEADFVRRMREKGNDSACAAFEKAMTRGDIAAAVHILRQSGGARLLQRHLSYLLSRCRTQAALTFVFSQLLEASGAQVLLQLLYRYAAGGSDTGARTFRFFRHNRLCVHRETPAEQAARRSRLSEQQLRQAALAIRTVLRAHCRGRLGRVYLDPAMADIALPAQQAADCRALPAGSKLRLPDGGTLRAYLYWRQADDLDLFIRGFFDDGGRTEFSWQTLQNRSFDGIAFSGDETAGYHGGWEYFDLDLPVLRAQCPSLRYLVFCGAVPSGGASFLSCVCRAGFRASGTNRSCAVCFPIDAGSTFAYLFAIDLHANDCIWLNVAGNGERPMQSGAELAFLKQYFARAEILSLQDLFCMLSREMVARAQDADVIVSDEEISAAQGQELIRSCDSARILQLLGT